MKHKTHKGGRSHYNDLHRKVDKLTISYYDGSGKTTAKAWV